MLNKKKTKKQNQIEFYVSSGVNKLSLHYALIIQTLKYVGVFKLKLIECPPYDYCGIIEVISICFINRRS